MPNSKPDLPGRCRTLPSVERLLVAGGDARIALDPESGLNKYGCRPFPDPALLSFGSSTASTVSQAGFEAAGRLRERLLTGDMAEETERIRRELLFDVADLNVGLSFASSGTDAHVMAARHAACARNEELCVVMVEEAETGSGVAAALASLGPDRVCVMSPVCVALRTGDGSPRPQAGVEADVVAAVESAVSRGARALLVMTDQSKTGLIAPCVCCAMELSRRFRGKLQVLVDACQYRIAPPTLRAYLQQGFMVALTGSKFFTGPSFSAALLLPGGYAQAARLETQCHAHGGQGDDFERAGSLLRWEAALAELRRFRALPEQEISGCMRTFSEAVQRRLVIDPRFEPLAVHPMDRKPLLAAQSWDRLQTVFPFLLYREKAGRERIPCSREETQRVYRQLQRDMSGGEDGPLASLRCQFGQPVACGVRAGIEVSALRLCLSARLISDAVEGRTSARLIEEAMLALDKAAWLVGRSRG